MPEDHARRSIRTLGPRRREPLSDELRHDLFGRESFVPVFVLALLTVVSFPVADSYHWGFLFTNTLLAATIILAFHRSQVSKHFLRTATVLVIIAAAGWLLAATAMAARGEQTQLLLGTTSALTAGLVLLAEPAIMRQTFRHRKVTINTLAAGVTAYLFIGLFFTSVFRFIHAVEGVPFFAHHIGTDGGEFQYFSFVTLTTLGYGDYVPATDVGQSAAVMEAIVGQVFLVTAVARIVSIMGFERPARGNLFDSTADEEPAQDQPGDGDDGDGAIDARPPYSSGT